MRHVYASRPVSARAFGMREPPSTTGLVTDSRRALATPPGIGAAIPSTVNLAAIATATDQRLRATPSAHKQPGRSSVVVVGVADAMWTNAQFSAILTDMRARHGVGHGVERNRQVEIDAVLVLEKAKLTPTSAATSGRDHALPH